MKSIMLNDIVYSVGDEVYLIVDDLDLSKIGVANYKRNILKAKISKITSSNYIYVIFDDSRFYSETRLEKDGGYVRSFYQKGIFHYHLTRYNTDIENKYNECEMQHQYIQNTFERLKNNVKSLTYSDAQKINAILDEIGK